jgi:hypothetical protein
MVLQPVALASAVHPRVDGDQAVGMSDQRRDDEDRAADGGSARYGQRSGTGANEPKHGERKEQREDWVRRQGGDQTRSDDEGRARD